MAIILLAGTYNTQKKAAVLSAKAFIPRIPMYICVCMCVCVYVCICAYICIYVYMCVYVHIYEYDDYHTCLVQC